MAKLDTESLEALRQSLPPLAEAGPLSQPMRDFCHYYNISPEDHLVGVAHRAGTLRSGKYNLAVHRWELQGATRNLLVVHGYTDHVGLFGHLVEYGLCQGCNVIAFDLPGHGLSSGETASIDEFADYSQAIHEVLAESGLPELPWWAMGQSTGCAALIDFARKYPWNFTATVFLAPLIRPAGWGRVRAGYLLLHRFKDSIGRKFADNSGDKEFLAFMQRDPLQTRRISLAWVGALRRWLKGLVFEDLGVGPLLVLQGDADATVDWRYNMQHIVKLFPGCQINYLAGAGHQLANETETIRSLYLEKVSKFVGFG